MSYAELHCLSHYSFLRGASQPHELVEAAAERGYAALALTDECSLAGIVRAHVAAQERGFKLIIGSEIRLEDGPSLVLLAPTEAAYRQLCRLITRGRRAADKGEYRLQRQDLADTDHCLAILLPPQPRALPTAAEAAWLGEAFPRRAWIGVELHRDADDAARLAAWQALAADSGLPLVACGDVHMHARGRRALQDTLTAIRHGCTLATAGARLFPNGERHLRRLRVLRQLYPEALLAESGRIAARCTFSLDQLRYRYPAEVPPDRDANEHLAHLTQAGLQERYPQGVPPRVQALVERELRLIREQDCPQYFLTVHAIMCWAKARGILCQGRGSAANSAVCFALGITVVDPARQSVLFERFLSAERREPPDIDVDFEHERREEVFQHIYAHYGRAHAALAATVIRYRPKSAIRDVGKVLGFALPDIERITRSLAWWDDQGSWPERLRELGFDPDSAPIRRLMALVEQLLGVPRHLSQHVGGFVISAEPLGSLVPIENAAMPERTVIQWEKRDLEAVGLFKVDCLALGMLTAIRKTLDLIETQHGQRFDIPAILATEAAQGEEAGAVFAMLGRAQSVGVFQVESRAQISMLPRMRPRTLYDLTVEVAIVRPGPIQGGMVHPYLERRERLRQNPAERFDCPAQLESILGRTYGIPIFQEQVMEVCVTGAGFAPGEANQVRRSMAAWGRAGYGKLAAFEQRLKEGFAANGIDAAFAERIFQQIQGFSEYGFPESHAASFASLVYVSAWLKRFHPAAFLCGLLNSQPMGFYSPSQLIQDFSRVHAVRLKPPDVTRSDWDCALEADGAVRLGLRQIKGLSEDSGRRIVACAAASPDELFRQCGLNDRERQALADADALRCLAGDRHRAHWSAQGFLRADLAPDGGAALPAVSEPEDIRADYASLGLSLRRHPVALLRPTLKGMAVLSARQWLGRNHGQRCRVAGLVTNRQRPGTAKGIIFMTLEDETGTINLIIRSHLLRDYRAVILQAPFIIAQGLTEHRQDVRHLMVETLEDRSALVDGLALASRDFH